MVYSLLLEKIPHFSSVIITMLLVYSYLYSCVQLYTVNTVTCIYI